MKSEKKKRGTQSGGEEESLKRACDTLLATPASLLELFSLRPILQE
jgi:hypothetical protein